jgi:DNA-directed RNA polymerase beta subunit
MRPGQPDIQPDLIRPTDTNWEYMRAGDFLVDQIAFNLKQKDEGKYYCPINRDFDAYTSAVADLKGRGFGRKALDAFEHRYMIICTIQAMTDLAVDIQEWNDPDSHRHRRAAIAGQLYLEHMRMVAKDAA